MSHMESYGDGPAALMSVGPSPALGMTTQNKRSHHHHHRHTKAFSATSPAYLCPIPIKSNSPLPSSSSRRKNNLGMPEKTQRQASEEISHILRRPAVQSFSISDDQHLLDGSRSADMFVTKRRTGTEGVLHYATPPVESARESSEASDSDSDVPPTSMVRDNSIDFLNLQDLREVMDSPSQSSCIRSASIQDLAVLADTQFTPPTRSQNPLPRSSPFAINDSYSREGAEIGLLSFSPPNSLLDEDLRARRAQYSSSAGLGSDFRNRQRFGDITPRMSLDNFQ